MGNLLPWLQLALCMLVIGIAGPRLARYGDVIARLTGLSRSWVGLVLLATATSLPELFTGISAVTVADLPDIAVGNVLGACVLNLAILVLLDELSRDAPMYRRIDQGHVLSAGFGVILIGAVGAFVILSHNAVSLSVLHVSAYTPLIVVLYIVAIRAAFVYARRAEAPVAPPEGGERLTLRQAILRYAGAAAIVVAAGVWLPFIGGDIAEVMGWKTSFVGTLLIAATTTVPEMVVTISAFRLGMVDLAIGNLLGSNLFDVLILSIDDFAYTKGPLVEAASPVHAVTAFAAVIMSGIFIVAMLYKPETRLRGTIGWTSIGLLLVYLLSSFAIYLLES